MSTDVGREDLIRPIQSTSKQYFALLGVALLAMSIWGYFYLQQLQHGMIVTNLGDWGSGGGVTWGLYIGAFIWWVGIAHGGIILSAAVRLFGMDRYQPVARLAELLTIGALSAAGVFIMIHVGRPDRLVTSVLPAWPTRVHWSPLVWDVTVITAYFVLTATYLALTVRYDIHRLRDQLPDRFDPLYDALTIGYTEREDRIVQRMVWWIAVAIIIMAPLLLHGGVIPWLFALLPSMPGWFGAVQGPTFLSIALTSAIAGVIVAAAIFRRAYDWHELITDDVFQGLSKWLAFFSLIFMWLQLQAIITGVYSPATGTEAATAGMVGEPLYWLSIGAVAAGFLYIVASILQPSLFSIPRLVAVSVFMLAGTLVEKTLFVVEGLMYPEFDLYAGTPGVYFPSVVELSAVLGTIAMVTLFFMIVAKVIPVVELHAIQEHDDHESTEHATPEEVNA